MVGMSSIWVATGDLVSVNGIAVMVVGWMSRGPYAYACQVLTSEGPAQISFYLHNGQPILSRAYLTVERHGLPGDPAISWRSTVAIGQFQVHFRLF